MDIIEFLRARLDEAEAATPGPWSVVPNQTGDYVSERKTQ